MDALVIGSDEGRCSMRKASGSLQTNIYPEMSEWGNPLNLTLSIIIRKNKIIKRTRRTETSK